VAKLVRHSLGPVAEVELDNPPLNLITAELMRQLREALTDAAESSDVRAVVLAAAGDRAFCAGSDLTEVASVGRDIAAKKLLIEKLVYRQLARLPVPTIAAIEAPALGGGLELALCCDFRVAGARASFGMPEVGLGAIPGSGGTQRLPRIIGQAHAKDLILTGKPIDAVRAERIGLINQLVDTGSARAAAHALAETIASRGPVAVREAKRLIDESDDRDIDAGLALELDASERIAATEDAAEGARAYFDKRDPRFVGR
jgi:enoyl-CoA hydratase